MKRKILLLVLLHCSVLCYAQTKIPVKLSANPKELLQRMTHNPAFVANAKGEDFCWNAAYGMGEFLDNFKLTADVKWLDAGISKTAPSIIISKSWKPGILQIDLYSVNN
ncbi:hypothetical protein ACVWYN_003548 [Pedobacter sp. UYP24]